MRLYQTLLWHFFSILGLKEHIEGAHEGKKKSFKCHICDKSVTTSTVLKRHIAAVHEKKRPFECHLCHERFGQKAHLITHLKGKHKMWTSSWEEKALLNAICAMNVLDKKHI